mgnify:CR=1 FL=1
MTIDDEYPAPGNYLLCPVPGCDWKMNVSHPARADRYGTPLTAHATHLVAEAVSQDVNADCREHLIREHPDSFADFMRPLLVPEGGDGQGELRVPEIMAIPDRLAATHSDGTVAFQLHRQPDGSWVGTMPRRTVGEHLRPPAPVALPRGFCSWCKESRALRSDGTIGRHLHMHSRSADQLYCPGTGKPPVQDDKPEEAAP